MNGGVHGKCCLSIDRWYKNKNDMDSREFGEKKYDRLNEDIGVFFFQDCKRKNRFGKDQLR